jgi:uncharacterized protein
MPTYKTPGVHIEEISKFPPSIAAVETAIPAFIGVTEKAVDDDGESLVNRPIRITSFLEFEQTFGSVPPHAVSVKVEQTEQGNGGPIIETKVSMNGTEELPAHMLYYSMRFFFANGGGPCYVVSIGDYGSGLTDAKLRAGIDALEAFDEPTLLVFPDASKLGNDDAFAGVVNQALAQCAKLGDRFTIADVRDALPGKTDTNAKVTSNFRQKVTSDLSDVKYGAAYFPYVRTRIPLVTTDEQVTVKTHKVVTLKDDGSLSAPADGPLKGRKLSDAAVKAKDAVYKAVKAFAATATATLPPSGGVAGVYARVDAERGVWKAPANVSLRAVSEPAVRITDDLNGNLNVDTAAGKSVNVIRSFVGKGPLVWGARTLAGNDNENRYVPVRRFLNFAQESIKKATGHFVYEPNDPNTWIKVRAMIENFLTIQWRDGALVGAKPEDAFYVAVGLNKTMTAQDVLDGYMIVEIGLAIVRPAEFIVLRFAQKMQQS